MRPAQVSRGNRSMSIVTESSPLADNFLQDVVVNVAIFVSKAQCVIIDVKVAVPVSDSIKRNLRPD